MSNYFVKLGNDKLGPFDFQRLKIMAESGTLHPDDYVSQDGFSWKIARYVPDLFTLSQGIGVEKTPPTPVSPSGSSRSAPSGTFIKIILFTAFCSILFGVAITFAMMRTSANQFAELTQKNAELLENQVKYDRELAQSVTLKSHKETLANQAAEMEKKHNLELVESQKVIMGLTKSLEDASKKLNEKDKARQVIVSEYNQLLETMKPFERLAKAYPKDAALQELLSNINMAKNEDFESLIRGLLSSTTKTIAPKASELREEYRLLRSTTSPNSAETFIRWNKMCKLLRDMGKDFKHSEPTQVTFSEIKTQKDILGVFMIRTLANETNTNRLKALVASSKADEPTKEKSLIAIDEGKKIANEIVILLGFNPEKYITGLLVPNPGIEPRKLIEEVGNATFKFKQIFEAREPKRLEYHLDTMAEISPNITKFALYYSDDFKLRNNMRNELVKYGIFTGLNNKIYDLEKKEIVKDTLQRDMVGWGNLPREELNKRLNALFNDMELARIAGLLPNQ